MVHHFPLPPLKREGYPVIDDPDHPLYAEACSGWPTLGPHEAMTKAVEHMAKSRANSRTHPAFDEGAIVNQFATRPEDDVKVTEQSKERR